MAGRDLRASKKFDLERFRPFAAILEQFFGEAFFSENGCFGAPKTQNLKNLEFREGGAGGRPTAQGGERACLAGFPARLVASVSARKLFWGRF